MSIKQLNFGGKDKVEVSIKLLQENEPSEGYQMCLSAGGKDSQVTEHLCQRAGVKYVTVYNRTGIDPPEAVKHLRENFPDAIIEKPEMSIWRWIEKKGLPLRQARWCCEKLKEYSGWGKVLVTGIRAEESPKRKSRKEISTFERGNKVKTFVNPIFCWSEMEVWEYIKENNLPYCELYDIDGWDRLGCILCPMTSWRRTLFEWGRYPKIAQAWFRASRRVWEKRPQHHWKWETPDDFIFWWLTRGEVSPETVKYKAQERGLLPLIPD